VKAALSMIVSVVLVACGATFLFVLSMLVTSCSSSPKVKPIRAVNPSAMQAQPHMFHQAENACASHGGVGLVQKIEYVCNDGMEGQSEFKGE